MFDNIILLPPLVICEKAPPSQQFLPQANPDMVCPYCWAPLGQHRVLLPTDAMGNHVRW